ncbi:MAG: SUMF1/EgtB/PvdO family nonheme iron enzyme [Planctomycetes bacterium]|nr:SUMF1/EgtB/PvdO family nonheme iron enzyme [Planctomycetota bacterium]
MTEPPPSPLDRLRRAVAVFAEHRSRRDGRSDAELLAAHPELSDLLEPMFAEPEEAEATLERRVGGFRIVGELGRGGMGVVHDAVQESLGRRVALKILPHALTLDPRAVARFRREAQTAAQLDHPHIVKVLEVGGAGDLHWIAMERIDGTPIRPGPIATVVAQVAQIADALDHAHRHGVVHRDVKPSNILVRPDGSAVLSDFGLAREEAAPTVTRTGEFAGTPYYVSPEQVQGLRVDARTDVYSLGATLYELLTGRHAFAAESTAGVLQQILDQDPADPARIDRRIPRDLSAIVLKAMEKDPARRYATAAEFAADLRAFLAHRPVRARHAGLAQRLRRWVRREPALAGAVAGIGVVLVAALAVSLHFLVQVDDALSEIRRLSDVQLVQEQLVAGEELWPALPDRVAAMDAWLAKSAELLARRPLHEARRTGLRAARGDDAERWQAQVLDELLARLDALAGLHPRVAARREFAAGVAARTLHEPAAAAAWREAIGYAGTHEPYRGLRLAPIVGLVPLGPDPHSRLLEFWHVASGERPEREIPTGRLRITEASGVVLVLIPGGSFAMGARRPNDQHPQGTPNTDPEASENEEPVHTVTLAPFLLAKYETTQAQWQRHTGANPSYYKSAKESGGYPIDGRHPVEMVSWRAAARVAGQLDLTLPTEAQWEYACRAGSTTPFPTGDRPASLQGHANIADRHVLDRGWKGLACTPEVDDGHWVHAPVGSFLPNRFGVHDILGNVAEHCLDPVLPYTTPVQGSDGQRLPGKDAANRGMRGGSWYFPANAVRSAHRWGDKPDAAYHNLGVRFARGL